MNDLRIRLASGLLSVGLVTGCTRSPEPAAHSAAPTRRENASVDASAAAGSFFFDWSTACRVPVRERVVKNGKAAVMSYTVSVRAADGGGFRVFLEELEFVELGGQPVTPKIREKLLPILELAKAIPAFHLSQDGRYVGCEDFNALTERMITELAMPPDRAEEFRRTLANPHTRSAIEQSIGNYWSTWVQSWIGWELTPGASTSRAVTLDLAGTPVPARVDRQYRNFDAGLATLQQTTTYSGEEAAAALLGFAHKQTQAAGEGEDSHVDPSAIKDQKLWIQLEAETRPLGLKPRFTRFERLFEFSIDGELDSSRELREATWLWDRAEGC